jgi:cytochrome c-type biogenesis protein
MELTLGAAFVAGVISFLSPCVLPVVPAYLGQLGAVAATVPLAMGSATRALGTPATAMAVPGGTAATATVAPLRPVTGWRAIPNAAAFVLGFGSVFTVLGVTAYVAAGPLRDNLPLLRQAGGVLLIVLGLNLMGVLRLRLLARSWKPFERFGGSGPRVRRGGVVGGFLLGGVFAVGWTPCIGPTLGAILTLAAVGSSPQVVALLVAYSLGLGIPFVLLALAVDRAPAITRPLLRHGRTIEVVGGALVIVLGVALIFDWLGWLARTFFFLWPQV